MNQLDALFFQGDFACFVECAEGLLEGFFAHAEAFGDFPGGRFVGVGEGAAGFFEGFEECGGEVAEFALADFLQREVEAAVGAHVHHGCFQPVAAMGLGENLIVIDHACKAVVHDDLEAEGRFLPDERVDLHASVVEAGTGVSDKAVDFRRAHDAPRLLVHINVHKVFAPLFHLHFLFAEGHEEVFHQSPREKCAVFVHPCHFEKGEVAHLAEWLFGGADEELFLVEIDKHVHGIAWVHLGTHIVFGHQYLADFAAVEVGSVVGKARDGQSVVFS